MAPNTSKQESNRKIAYMGNTMTSSSTLINHLLNMKQEMLFSSFLAFLIFFEVIHCLIHSTVLEPRGFKDIVPSTYPTEDFPVQREASQ